MATRDTSAARAARAAKRTGGDAADRSAAAADREQRKRDPDLRGPKGNALALLLVGVALVVLVFIGMSGASYGMSSSLAGLVLWTGGTGWRFRSGQYVDPAAAASLVEIGEAVASECNPVPMTLDISREGGGLYPPHKSHQKGVDVDVRMSDLPTACRVKLQAEFAARGWTVWYDGPDAAAPTAGGRHITHLHARFPGLAS